MAIKTKDEILASIKTKFGEDTSDETLALIEDITDTISDMESKTKDTTNWKEKFEQNDAEWRKKYRDRFFSKGSDDDENDLSDNENKDKPMSYNDLFKEEK